MTKKVQRILAIAGLTLVLLPICYATSLLMFPSPEEPVRPEPYPVREPASLEEALRDLEGSMAEYEEARGVAGDRMLVFFLLWPLFSVGGAILLNRWMIGRFGRDEEKPAEGERPPGELAAAGGPLVAAPDGAAVATAPDGAPPGAPSTWQGSGGRAMQKPFFVYSIAAGLGVGFLIDVVAAIVVPSGDGLDYSEAMEAVGLTVFLKILAALPRIFAAVIMCLLYYRAWAAIQDGHARTTPGKAIGFVFIPLFNFYWIFQTFLGFAKDHNALVRRHSLKGPILPEWVFLALPITLLAALIPYVEWVATIAAVGLHAFAASLVCDAVTALPRGEGAALPSGAAAAAPSGEPGAPSTWRSTRHELQKPFYVWSLGGALGLGVLLEISGAIMGFALSGEVVEPGDVDIVGVLFFLQLVSFAPKVYAAIVVCMLYYWAWTAIQDGHARTPPVKAIGFLFIPFYNFYWIFQAFWGFAKDHNALARRHRLEGALLPEAVFLAIPIAHLCTVVPIVQYLAWIALVGLHAFAANKVCDAVGALPRDPEAAPPDPKTVLRLRLALIGGGVVMFLLLVLVVGLVSAPTRSVEMEGYSRTGYAGGLGTAEGRAYRAEEEAYRREERRLEEEMRRSEPEERRMAELRARGAEGGGGGLLGMGPDEPVAVRHIVIQYTGARGARPNVTRTREEARALAADLTRRARAPGADFEALAREHSDGPTGPRGGDLGVLRPGRLVPEFERAAVALGPDEVSEPLETPFGFHVIQRYR